MKNHPNPNHNSLNPYLKSLQYVLIGTLLLIGLIFSFEASQKETQSPNKRIFEIEKHVTWHDVRPFWGGIISGMYRMVLVDNFETVIPTHNAWDEFDLSFNVINPNNFGIAYQYQDKENYHFLAVFVDGNAIVWGSVHQGSPRWSAREEVQIDFSQRLRFQMKEDEAKLFVGEKLIASESKTSHPGRAGLMILESGDARTQFKRIDISGITTKGAIIDIRHHSPKAWNMPVSVFVLYTFFIGFIFFLRQIFRKIITSPQKSISISQKYAALSFRDKALYFLTFLGGSLFFTRLIQASVWFKWKRFTDIEMWGVALMSLSVYVLVLLLAYLYKRIWNILNVSTFFMTFLFLFYALSLVNVLTIKIDDTLFLRLCFIGLVVPIVIKLWSQKGLKFDRLKSNTGHFLKNVLICLWFLFAFLYFAEYNFQHYRYPHTDERSFWFVAAQNTVEFGVKEAGEVTYSSGRTHAIGVPYITALPALFWDYQFPPAEELSIGVKSTTFIKAKEGPKLKPWERPGYDSPLILFFMPFVFLLSLLSFLIEIRSQKWCFLFIYFGLFFSFDFNWMGHLIYRSLYAEGIAMILFLGITYSLWNCLAKKEIQMLELGFLSLCMGLLSLSKIPASYFSLVFAILFIILIRKQKKYLKKSFIILMAVILPLVVWKIYGAYCHYGEETFQLQHIDLNKVSFKENVFTKMYQYIWSDYFSVIIFSGVSLIFIFILGVVKENLLAIPVILLATFIFIYYAWFCTGEDHESAIRYVSSGILALYFLGGVVLQKFMEGKGGSKRSY